MRLARVKHKPTMTTSMEKAKKYLLHNFYFWIFVKPFFQWSVGDFSKVENSKFVNMHYTFFGTSWKISHACKMGDFSKVENLKYVNMHYTFFGMAWKISHVCKIILLDQSLNCMEQKFYFLIFTHGFSKISLRDFNFL